MSDEEAIVENINNALTSPSSTDKIHYFAKIKELLLYKAPQFLSKYLSNVLNFTTDKQQDIKRALVGFIEELCKTRENHISQVMVSLHMLLCDESLAVQKRVIQATISIYRKTLAWLCKATNITEEMQETWKQMSTIKLEIANMIDSDNDGIRTSSVKFLECVVLLQSYPDEVESKKTNDFSLDNVPLTLKIARRRKLEEEASNLFELLVKFHGSPHISSANLLACIGVLTNIARNRANFIGRVVHALESLYNNLPPTLSTTQVSSVKKKLKSELSGLIRHPGTYEYVHRIGQLLLDLGVSQNEINKMVPKADERRKYQKRVLVSDSISDQPPAKKIHADIVDLEDDPTQTVSFPQTPHDINEKWISDNLTIEKAVYLIFTSIPKLPSSMTPSFAKDYAKYVASERIGKPYLAEILANQFIEAKVGPGVELLQEKEKKDGRETNKRKRDADNDDTSDERIIKKEKVRPPPVKAKALKLTEITRPLPKESKEKLLVAAVIRLLKCDKTKNKTLQQKIITTLASNFSFPVRQAILTHILSDLRAHIDTALSWLFDEYSIMQGFTRIPPLRKGIRPDECYNILLCSLIQAASGDAIVLSRLLLESPLITDEALEEIKIISRDEKRTGWALGLLKDLTLKRPPKQLTFLNALLLYTTYESNIIRDAAIGHILDLHKHFELRLIIEEFAKMTLEFLKLSKPPENLCGETQGRIKSETWNDEFIKACLLPYISLLAGNPSLIHDLTTIYVDTNPTIKRIILRLLENPIRTLSPDCPDLLKLIENCTKGSETLVTRVIHVLTDKTTPNPVLVDKVRELYNTKISDVRLLIPLLTGLTKSEIITALPQLIKLNPILVREVFNRLFGLHGESSISASDLLVGLHLIDSSKSDLKTVIKAVSLCLQEKKIYTQEILAVVLQQLMDQPTLPTLLMRTVIQALGSYPRLIGFVMNILQRLILKQVWKHKVVWEGFIKCCQRTKPQSFAVLMQLPPQQLSEVFSVVPELQTALQEHLNTFTEAQRVHIPMAVQQIIFNNTQATAVTTAMGSTGTTATTTATTSTTTATAITNVSNNSSGNDSKDGLIPPVPLEPASVPSLPSSINSSIAANEPLPPGME